MADNLADIITCAKGVEFFYSYFHFLIDFFMGLTTVPAIGLLES